MHREKYDVAVVPQSCEERKHEADVVVLDREPRLVEQDDSLGTGPPMLKSQARHRCPFRDLRAADPLAVRS
jgi:hypothetical protein